MRKLIQLTEHDIVKMVTKILLQEGTENPYTTLYQNYTQLYNSFIDKISGIGATDYDYTDPKNYILLSNGKFRGAKLPKQLILDVISASKKAGTDPYWLLGLIGQESTFGNGAKAQERTGYKQGLVSGWSLRNKYKPYEVNRFLADNRVPGITTQKNKGGYHFVVSDPNMVNTYLTKTPQLETQYLQKLKATPPLPSDYDDFYEAALWIKQKGLNSYNPGDKSYASKVNQCIQLLRTDRNLTAFMKNPVLVQQPVAMRGRIHR